MCPEFAKVGKNWEQELEALPPHNFCMGLMQAFFSASNGSCSVHEWAGAFHGETIHFRMTSVCGHVMTLDFIGKYNNWDRVDPVSC
jgi:hypothetical protein